MSTAAFLGAGSSLSHSTTSGGTYTPFVEPVKIGWPKQSIPKVEATNLGTSTTTKEYIPGIIDPAEINVEANYNRADYSVVAGQQTGLTYYKITLGNGDSFAFAGYVAKLDGDDIEIDKKLVTKYSIQISGVIAFTAGSGVGTA